MKKLMDYFKASTQKSTDTGLRLVLKYQAIPIGYLWFDNERFFFHYDAKFGSSGLAPLADFQDGVEKVYTSPTLFPFFETRIPSLKRPDVLHSLNKKGLTISAPLLHLLAELGKKSSSDPYTLEVATNWSSSSDEPPGQ